jgi:succinyl-diaminopimelate desuccinylase
MTSDRDDLVQRLLDHCSLMCVTGDEGPIADAVEATYRNQGHPVTRIGHSVVVGEPSGDHPLVVLVGHLDVVAPTDDDRDPRVESRPDGDVVVARGTSDMKAGNVVAMKLFEEAVDSPYDLALVLYAGEEGSADGNELRSVLAGVPWLGDAALAVVLEPTDGQVQLGCLGGLHATLTVHGRQAHSARPWHGDNALTKAGAFLAAFHEREPLVVEVDGIDYRDVWSFTQASTTTGKNVIPGQLTLNLNFRFAPSRGLDEAANELQRVVDRVARDTGAAPIAVDVVDVSPPAPPRASDPIVAAFVRTVGVEVAAKQAWTDVARFAEIGVPALNYGPGRTDQAHQRGEFVEVDAIVEAYERLGRFLSTTPG